MIPNIKTAKKHIGSDTGFSRYSAAYVVTNEDLRNAFSFMQKNAENVLTVAASGDHPMFSVLYGAKHTDVFDISYNAKIIMDIKTAALKKLEYDEYCELLTRLFRSKDLLAIDNMSKIVNILSPIQKAYVKGMQHCAIFSKGIKPFIYKSAKPTPTEYDQMRQNIDGDFIFIWSGITSLHTKLNKTYDFMHLSNIFDYIDTERSAKTLSKLATHTKIGSCIYFELCPYYRENVKKIIECRNILNKKQQQWDFFVQTNAKTTNYLIKRIR